MPVTKVCKKHYLFLFYVCEPTLSVLLSSLSTSDKRNWIFTCGRHRICFPDCSKSRYLQKLYKVAFFFFFSLCVFWRCHILNRCRLKKPAPHSPTPSSFFISLSALSCPVLKPLGTTLTPAHLCLFSDSRWQKKSKERMQTGNGRLALGLLQRGIKNQCYLSLIYFKAKTVYWVQKQYFFFLPTQNTVATSTVPPQRNHGCCSNPRVVYISLIVIYVCLHLSQMMIA